MFVRQHLGRFGAELETRLALVVDYPGGSLLVEPLANPSFIEAGFAREFLAGERAGAAGERTGADAAGRGAVERGGGALAFRKNIRRN